MRAFGLLVVCAVAANAVSLHKSFPKLAGAGLRDNEFGAAVLAELDAHLQAGGPADDLMRILSDIRTRINDAQAEDDRRHGEDLSYCADTKRALETQLANKRADISTNEDNQDTARDKIDEWNATVIRLEGEIEQQEADIQTTKDIIAARIAKRAEDAATYASRDNDTDECITAIDEIIAIEQGSNLRDAANEADFASNYNNREDGRRVLLGVAQKVKDSTAQGLVTAAAVAMAAGDATDDLANLLARLASELRKYKQELRDAEDQAIAEDTAQNAIEEALLASQEDALVDLQNTLQDARNSLASWQGRLATLETEHARLVHEEGQIQTALDAHNQQCSDWNDEYDARAQTRTEELQTVSDVEAIVTARLGHLFDDTTKSRTGNDVYQNISGRV